MQFTKKTNIIEAVRWFSHGDHPKVQRLETPFHACSFCHRASEEHGIIRNIKDMGDVVLKENIIICPGDYIVSQDGYPELCSYHPDKFEKKYVPVFVSDNQDYSENEKK